MSLERTNSRFEWIDYARFAAALSVMSYHYLVNGIRNGKLTGIGPFEGAGALFQYGYLGVPLFFMISGFVIMSSARSGSPVKFVISRVFRLWPAFVFCMTLTSIVLAIWPSPLMPISAGQYFVNLTMIPTSFGWPVVDGVYWTLKTEIIFYASVLAILSLNLISYAQIIVEIWIAWLIVSFAVWGGHGFLGGYDAFFAAGCSFYFMYQDGFSPRTLLATSACAVMGLCVAELPTTDFINATYGPTLSRYVVGVIVLGFFVVFLGMKASRAESKPLPFARQIGALTYPMYLLHAYIGYTLMSRFGSSDRPLFTVFIMAVAVLIASYLVARFVELPVQRLRPVAERGLSMLLRPARGTTPSEQPEA